MRYLYPRSSNQRQRAVDNLCLCYCGIENITRPIYSDISLPIMKKSRASSLHAPRKWIKADTRRIIVDIFISRRRSVNNPAGNACSAESIVRYIGPNARARNRKRRQYCHREWGQNACASSRNKTIVRLSMKIRKSIPTLYAIAETIRRRPSGRRMSISLNFVSAPSRIALWNW